MAYHIRSGATLFDSDLTFREEVSYQYNKVKKAINPHIDKARVGINRARAFASQGPLNSIALARADKIALETGNYKPLARLAGKQSLYNKMFSGTGHQIGKQWAKEALGLPSLSGYSASGFEKSGALAGKNFLGRALGAGFTAYSAFEGYQKEGAIGAIKGVAESVASQYIFGRLTGAGMTVLGGAAGYVAGAAVIGTGAYMQQKYFGGASWMNRDETYEYRRRNANMDLGSPSIDPFGNNATIRQRSLSAIQGSRLNGRSMLGNEAFLFYKPW